MDPLFVWSGLLPAACPALWLVREHFGFGGQSPGGKAGAGGVSFSVCGVDNVLDLHGHVVDPNLVVFFSGNRFMMVPELMRAFQAVFPKYPRIYFETLPPGILEQQIRTGALVMGNLRVRLEPDVLTCGQQRIRRLNETEDWFDEITPYLRNRLVLMVRQGNPRHVAGWQDRLQVLCFKIINNLSRPPARRGNCSFGMCGAGRASEQYSVGQAAIEQVRQAFARGADLPLDAPLLKALSSLANLAPACQQRLADAGVTVDLSQQQSLYATLAERIESVFAARTFETTQWGQDSCPSESHGRASCVRRCRSGCVSPDVRSISLPVTAWLRNASCSDNLLCRSLDPAGLRHMACQARANPSGPYLTLHRHVSQWYSSFL